MKNQAPRCLRLRPDKRPYLEASALAPFMLADAFCEEEEVRGRGWRRRREDAAGRAGQPRVVTCCPAPIPLLQATPASRESDPTRASCPRRKSSVGGERRVVSSSVRMSRRRRLLGGNDGDPPPGRNTPPPPPGRALLLLALSPLQNKQTLPFGQGGCAAVARGTWTQRCPPKAASTTTHRRCATPAQAAAAAAIACLAPRFAAQTPVPGPVTGRDSLFRSRQSFLKAQISRAALLRRPGHGGAEKGRSLSL